VLLAYSPLPVIVYERESSRIVAVSDSAVACYGYSREAFQAMTIPDLFPAEDLPSLQRFFETNLSRERPGRIEAVSWRHRRKDAAIIDVEVTGDDLEYHGQACRVLFCQDVTEQNRAAAELHEARERLRASEERYRLLFEQNPQPMVAHDRETLQIVAANNAMVTSYGYSREELLAMTVAELQPHEDVERLRAHIAATPRGTRPGPAPSGWRHQRRDGTIMDIEVTSENVELDGRECRIALFTDVTERNRATSELLQAREQLSARADEHRLLFERNPQPLLVYDVETLRFVAASDAAIRSTGYSREEFVEMTLLDLAPAEDHPGMGIYARIRRGERLGFLDARLRRHRRKDGTIIDVEITSDDLVLGGRDCRVCLCLDVTERNRVNAELALARDQAVEASNMKSAFLANMSHEIRTPMNGVIGMTELLLDMNLSVEQRECAEQIARSGELTLAVISDILDLSKIETGHLELDITDFDLRDSIARTCSAAGAQARANGLRLDMLIDDQVPRRVRGDSRRLDQVILNLVSNAIKFTPSGAIAVRVSATPVPDAAHARIRVEVADSGIGIDPGNLTRMFEPFTQADVSTTRLYGGTGLGLAISRELVELMGGTISAESQVGEGSTFWFELVLAVGDEPDTRPAPALPSSATAPQFWADAPLVLIAEDSQVNQIVAARALERCGCRAHIVSDGLEAIEAFSRQRYDAVLMDCQMPNMDGYQATAELRSREAAGRHTPVIAMTAHAMAGDRQRCLDAGMDDYISKPMRHADLAAVLVAWIPTRAHTNC
jgi:PAS domain S-box-containing protein